MTDDVWSQYGEEFSVGGGGFKKPWTVPDNGFVELGYMTQMGPLRQDPDGWFRGHKRHWGYSVRRKDDPTKTHKITFRCPEKRGRGGIVLEACPQDVKYEGQEAAFKDYEVQLRRDRRADGSPRSEEEIKNLLAPLNGWLRSFSRENKVWLYAMNAAGEFNKFTTSWKTFFQLRDAMNDVEKELKINPRSPRNLVFFRIKRTGSAKAVGSMSESVERVRESVEFQGRIFEQVKKVALTEEQLRKGIDQYVSLDEVDTYDLTFAQIKALTECSEDPEEVERIIGIGTTPRTGQTTQTTPDRRGAADGAPVTPAAPVQTPIPATPPPAQSVEEIKHPAATPTVPPVNNAEIEALMARIAALQAAQAAPPAAVPTPAASPPPTPTPSAPSLAGMTSMTELLAKLNLKPVDVGVNVKPAA